MNLSELNEFIEKHFQKLCLVGMLVGGGFKYLLGMHEVALFWTAYMLGSLHTYRVFRK